MRHNIYETLGIAVRTYRARLGWTQEELGERSGLHPSYIGQIERGVKKVSLETLRKLSAALNVGIADILGEKPVRYEPSGWEEKLLGVLRDRPAREQSMVYRIAREALRGFPRGK